ncbi:Ig-like domain-containing protein [Ruminococcaceae bacterium OttesenSCG-928-D13]|nr:Ig-like domain-containing protein [Ruminococcaceae bacterium OttesenSCG-928-D13]
MGKRLVSLIMCLCLILSSSAVNIIAMEADKNIESSDNNKRQQLSMDALITAASDTDISDIQDSEMIAQAVTTGGEKAVRDKMWQMINSNTYPFGAHPYATYNNGKPVYSAECMAFANKVFSEIFGKTASYSYGGTPKNSAVKVVHRITTIDANSISTLMSMAKAGDIIQIGDGFIHTAVFYENNPKSKKFSVYDCNWTDSGTYPKKIIRFRNVSYSSWNQYDSQAGAVTLLRATNYPPESNTVAVTSVKLNKSNLTLNKGASETLTATISPSNATTKTVTWSTSNASVATVSGGKVTAKAPGTATITAKSNNGKTATCAVTVKSPLSSISLSHNTAQLRRGSSLTLMVSYNPSDTTDSKTISWSSSNDAVATVSGGKITPVGDGEAVITARVGSKSATCAVTVYTVHPTSIQMNTSQELLTIGQTLQLQTSLLPTTAFYDGAVIWRSDNTKVATVDENGFVTGLAAGSATITATIRANDTSLSASCTIDVCKSLTGIRISTPTLDLKQGKSEQLSVGTVPAGLTIPTAVRWSVSEGAGVVTVSDTGRVTAQKEGVATVTATVTVGDSTFTDSCIVNVHPALTAVRFENGNAVITELVLKKGAADVDLAGMRKIYPSGYMLSGESWASSNTKVASVSTQGLLQVKGLGTTTITCTAKGTDCSETAKLAVKVVADTTSSPLSISLGKTELTLKTGESYKIQPDITPANATIHSLEYSLSSQAINAGAVAPSSGGRRVVDVAEDGTITGVCPGTARVRVTVRGFSDDTVASQFCEVTVTSPLRSIKIIGANGSTAQLVPAGQELSAAGLVSSLQLNAVLTPADATCGDVVWKSSDSQVVTVDRGRISAGSKTGTATITAEAGDKKASLTVKVSQAPVSAALLNPGSVTLEMGNTTELTPIFLPITETGAELVWKSSNTKVATVVAGIVSPVKPGKVTVTATDTRSGKKATASVTVVQSVTTISIKENSGKVNRGATLQLKAVLNAGGHAPTNKGITWASSDPPIAKVSSKGAVKGIKAGVVTITATAKDSGRSASCTMAVLTMPKSVKISQKKATMWLGSTITLGASTSPSLEELSPGQERLSWTSSDSTKVRIVSGADSRAVKIEAIGEGKSTLTVTTANGKKAKIVVTVSPKARPVQGVILSESALWLKNGKSTTLKAIVVRSNASNKALRWEVVDERTASGAVSASGTILKVSATGKVTALRSGSATVRVTTVDGGYVATCKVYCVARN